MTLPSLFSKTAKHVVAIFHANPIELVAEGSPNCIKGRQGTLSLIGYRGHYFGITNQHVVDEATKKQHAFYVALGRHRPIPGRLLFQSTQANPDLPFDVAVFLLDEAAIRTGNKNPVDLERSFEPLSEGDQAIAVGFPSTERRMENPVQMSHGLYHVVAQCHCASDRTIVLQEQLTPPENRVIRFGGMSGGAIFRLTSADSYSFSGVVFQGRGFDERCADDTVQTDSHRGDQIWIYGFPFSPESFERALDIFQPNLRL